MIMVGTSAFAHCAGHGSLLALRFYGGLSVACDVSIWQHWSMRKWLGWYDRDARKFTGDYSGCVRLILNKVELLAANGVRPVCVMDGRALLSKAGEQEKRAAARKRAEEAMAGHSQSLESKEGLALVKKLAKRCKEFHEQLYAALAKRGYMVIVAPGEADAQAVAMDRRGMVDAVLTGDADLLVHGARVVIVDTHTHPLDAKATWVIRSADVVDGTVPEHNCDEDDDDEEGPSDAEVVVAPGAERGKDKVLALIRESGDNYTRHWQLAVVIAGGDYSPGIKGVGVPTAAGWVLELLRAKAKGAQTPTAGIRLEVKDVCAMMQVKLNAKVNSAPDGSGFYVGVGGPTNVHRAMLAFNHQIVYNPFTAKLECFDPECQVHTHPNEWQPHVGDHTDTNSLAIAQGRVNPFDLSAMLTHTAVMRPNCGCTSPRYHPLTARDVRTVLAPRGTTVLTAAQTTEATSQAKLLLEGRDDRQQVLLSAPNLINDAVHTMLDARNTLKDEVSLSIAYRALHVGSTVDDACLLNQPAHQALLSNGQVDLARAKADDIKAFCNLFQAARVAKKKPRAKDWLDLATDLINMIKNDPGYVPRLRMSPMSVINTTASVPLYEQLNQMWDMWETECHHTADAEWAGMKRPGPYSVWTRDVPEIQQRLPILPVSVLTTAFVADRDQGDTCEAALQRGHKLVAGQTYLQNLRVLFPSRPDGAGPLAEGAWPVDAVVVVCHQSVASMRGSLKHEGDDDDDEGNHWNFVFLQ